MKIPDEAFPQGTPTAQWEFFNWTQMILNGGRYEMRILGAAPDWVASDGEVVLVQTATERSLYAYITDGWYNLNWDTSGGVRGVPAGTILPFAGPESALPTGYALCNGGHASRTTYSVLFAVIGTLYNSGDEPDTEFALPDLRGRVPLGCDIMVTAGNRATIEANASTVGKGGGSEYLHGHAHTITTYYNGITPGGPSRYTSTLNADSTSYGTNVTGSGSSQNLMPYQTVLYIIKL